MAPVPGLKALRSLVISFAGACGTSRSDLLSRLSEAKRSNPKLRREQPPGGLGPK